MPETVLIGILITATGLLIVFTLLACLHVISKILLSINTNSTQITTKDNLLLTSYSNDVAVCNNDIPYAAIMAAIAVIMEGEIVENNNDEGCGFRVRSIKEIYNH